MSYASIHLQFNTSCNSASLLSYTIHRRSYQSRKKLQYLPENTRKIKGLVNHPQSCHENKQIWEDGSFKEQIIEQSLFVHRFGTSSCLGKLGK